MDYEDFYLLEEADLRGALRVRARGEFDPYALVSAKWSPPSPLVFERLRGEVPFDLIATGYSSVYLLSDRAIALLRSEHITGWTTFPTEVYGRRREPINGYCGLALTGRCGPIENQLSKLVWRDPPVPEGQGYQVRRGLYFDLKSWDGSDMCIPEGSGFKLVVKRVKEAFQRAKLTNVCFTRLSDVERGT